MPWTTSTPTTKGYYWMVFGDCPKEVTMGFYDGGAGWCCSIVGSDEIYQCHNFSHFMGPIVAPPAPWVQSRVIA